MITPFPAAVATALGEHRARERRVLGTTRGKAALSAGVLGVNQRKSKDLESIVWSFGCRWFLNYFMASWTCRRHTQGFRIQLDIASNIHLFLMHLKVFHNKSSAVFRVLKKGKSRHLLIHGLILAVNIKCHSLAK